MSGIFGLVNFNDQPIDQAVFNALLTHQASADVHVYLDNTIGFGCSPLVTSRDDPAYLKTDNFIIVAAARLDNRAELLAQFRLDRAADAEILLAAYQKWGEDCPQRLIGDFAFALWDAARRRLFCATDPFGVRPLYYARTPSGLAFASDIDVLLAVPEIDRSLNQRAVLNYLLLSDPAPSDTFYQHIQHLPARHSLCAADGNITLREYWSLDPEREVSFKSDADYEAAFLDLFREAVRCRLPDTAPVGAMLSGGLDSSAVSAVASDWLQQAGHAPLHTFYLASPSPGCDESPYVQSVAQQANTVHRDLPYLSPLTDVDRFIDPASSLPTTLYYAASLNLFRTAQAAGVRVILTGVDGDNTVGHGRAYLAELAAKQQWDALASNLGGLCEHFGGTPTPYLRHYVVPVLREWVHSGQWGAFASGVNTLARRWQFSRRRLIWKEGIRPRIPAALLAAQQRWRGHSPQPNALPALIRPEAQRWLAEADSEPPRTARAEQIAGLLAGTLAANFAAYDQLAARTGVEVRHPFSDRRLVEFCVALPPEQKIRLGWTRWILRRSLAGSVPDAVRWRSGKLGYGDHLIDSLRGADRDTLRDLLDLDTSAAEWVDLPAARQRYQQFLDNPTLPDATLLVRIARLNYWLRRP